MDHPLQFADYSPPASPTLADQQDALQKGLGRAMQWALAGKLADEPLLAACLRDGRYDSQVDDARGDWLWTIIVAAGAAGCLRVPILHALYDLPDECTAVQLCQFARHYAADGDDAFRERLYAIVEQRPFEDRDSLGEEDLIRLDGERGFLFAAGVRGRELASRDWDCDAMLVENAVEYLGAERVDALLDAAADEETRRFVRGWRSQIRRVRDPNPQQSHIDRMRAIGVEVILAEAESNRVGSGRLRAWGMHADEANLEIVLQRLWAARDAKVIVKLLRVFSNRALPLFDARLIELCRHSDEDVRRWARSALSMNAHPLVRKFALAEMAKGPPDRGIVSLFVRNYMPSDEHRLLDAIELPSDCDLSHWLLMDVTKLLESNPTADCSRLGVAVYALTPCGHCRFHAARLLQSRGAAPHWLGDECCHDAEADCRAHFRGIVLPPDAQ